MKQSIKTKLTKAKLQIKTRKQTKKSKENRKQSH